MFERITDHARRALTLAAGEARRLNHDHIDTEHLLLGIVGEEDGLAVRVLVELNVDADAVRRAVEAIVEQGDTRPPGHLPFTPQARQVLGLSRFEADQAGEEHIGTEHLLLGLLSQVDGVAAQALRTLDLDLDGVREVMRRLREAHAGLESATMLGEFGRSLTREARRHEIGRVIGRDREVEQVMRILTRRTKNCPVLVGESGIDKAAIVHGLARMIAGPGVPGPFYGRTVFAVHPRELRERLAEFTKAVRRRDDVILFVEEIHTAKDLLGVLLSVEGLRIIGTTTPDDYRRLVGDPAVERRFQPVEVVEPTVPAAVELLRGERDRYETHHLVRITDEALVAAAALARVFVTGLPLPDSAFELLDEAGATLRLRDVETHATGTWDELESKWLSGELSERVPTLDEDVVAEIVAARVGLPVARVRAVLPADTAVPDVEHDYALLTDQPAESGDDDLLGTADIARGIATILAGAASPFVLAVDGSWGVGKSTLLRQIEDALPGPPDMVKVRFNAWTAQGENALEALIKSVIGELDSNLLRRWLRGLVKRQRVVGFARVGLAVVARFFGVTRLVAELWARLQVNASSRNEFRTLVQGMLAEWTDRPGQPRKTLVVFIDDLDRCADDVVVKVCEAVKLYLDAPGLVFVIGCDLSVLARGVATKARGGEGEGRTYLEKIVQVVHRVPVPNRTGVANLIRGYAARAGITALADDTMVAVLAEQTGRNPRRIKRIINSFVLEHALNPAWRRPPLGSAALIAVVILQHLYPQFYERLANEGAGTDEDPISEFLDYATVRARAGVPPSPTDTWWATASRVFRRYGAAPPAREAGVDLSSDVDRFERILPPWFPELALNEALLALLREIGFETRLALRARLVNQPLGTSAFPEPDHVAAAL